MELALEVLLAAVVSVGELTVAEFVITVPASTDASGRTTNVNTELLPFGSDPMGGRTQFSMELPPVQLQAGPLTWFNETNVNPGGAVSLQLADVTADGPLLVMVMVYDAFDPAVIVVGPVFVIETSAVWP